MVRSSVVFAGIAPHPPIMVPEVGGEAADEVRASINAMRDFTERIIDSGAETVVLISPHAPLAPRAFVAYQEGKLHGSFANFRAPETELEVMLDEEMLSAIGEAAHARGYEVIGISGHELDHGTAVPLYFLLRNGWRGRVVALGYTFLSNEDHLNFGSCISEAAAARGRAIAFVASGDLSHRLKPGAPAGYDADAHLFDEEIVSAIRARAPERVINIDQELRRTAGECGYRSMLVALGVAGDSPESYEVLSYEAPFGVGYLVAQLMFEREKESENIASETEIAGETEQASDALDGTSGAELPALARLAVETFIREGRQLKPPASSVPRRAACFVSIKTLARDLRGCIGTIEPLKESLEEELIANAINAATRDPRFPPVSPAELSDLRYSVDVLSAPETARFEELDPKIYGVIVEDEHGTRRGLLLPDIEGVETTAQQVSIAARKAGIKTGTPLKLYRFRVERFSEPAQSSTQPRSRQNGK
jgi:AmmeMemoRadiSam system protein A/AmmeMemoRadiSam system protein B